MEKIVIIGCGGSGKSTLARKLGDKLSLPVVHLDRIWWRPGWVSIPREEFDRLLAAELAKPQWIIDGNFNRTIPQRLAACDTVIYLDYNRFVCLWGMLHRVLTGRNKTRPDITEGCPERLNWEFISFIWNYNKTCRKNNLTLLSQLENVKVHIFRNRRQTARFLKNL